MHMHAQWSWVSTRRGLPGPEGVPRGLFSAGVSGSLWQALHPPAPQSRRETLAPTGGGSPPGAPDSAPHRPVCSFPRGQGWTLESGRLCLCVSVSLGDCVCPCVSETACEPVGCGTCACPGLADRDGPSRLAGHVPLLPCLAGAGGSGHRGQVGPTLAHAEDPRVPAGR